MRILKGELGIREGEQSREGGASKIRKGKSYKKRVRELVNVNVNVIRPSVSAKWNSSKLGIWCPPETGRQRPYHPDDYASKKWLSGL